MCHECVGRSLKASDCPLRSLHQSNDHLHQGLVSEPPEGGHCFVLLCFMEKICVAGIQKF